MQLVLRLHRADHLVAPDDLGKIEAFQAAQAVLLDAAPGHGGTGAHLGFEKVAGFPAHLGVLLRQVAGKQQHGDEASQQGPRPHHEEVEHAERLGPHLDEEAVDDEVGGGADQGQHAAKSRREAHGQQQPGGRMVGVAFDRPQHGGHHGGVVDERRQEGGGEPHLHQHLVERACAHQVGEPAHDPGLLHRQGDQQQQHQGQQGAVGVARHHGVDVRQAAQVGDEHGAREEQRRPEFALDQQGDEGSQQTQHQGLLPGHGLTPCRNRC